MATVVKSPDWDLARADLQTAVDEATVAAADTGHRKHLGASVIGKACARHLWFVFRWAGREDFEARMLRLFERGHREEPSLVALLRAAGAEVWEADPATGEQFRIKDCDGHFGGSCDGVARKLPGLPPKLAALLEFKTANDKSFAKLKAEGVQKAKPEHWTQMQVYMLKLKLKVALYMAVNKNDDELYYAYVPADARAGQAALRRAQSIIYAEEAPPRISETPGFWQCRFCSHVGVCHLAETPEVNCRTCAHATPVADGEWSCALGQSEAKTQEGCPKHVFNPHLLDIKGPGTGDADNNWLELELRNGKVVRNGSGKGAIPSVKLKLK